MQIQNTQNHSRNIYGSAQEWQVLGKVLEYCKTYFDDMEIDSTFCSLDLAPDDPDNDEAWHAPFNKLITQIEALSNNQVLLLDQLDYAVLRTAVDESYEHILNRPDYDDIKEVSFEDRACLAKMRETFFFSINKAPTVPSWAPSI